ncbi:formamidopyrimidine-DNA glycosylase [Nostocoides sp. F2B08]|uniref:Fpg/Nei family DNA glycosylase n=1 Tax=Nostocoides sp. F2B08 TaxID=2653936 RepID=UPI001263C393|nr:DNA-formamidopyrimidine glycosylase family protein [Tetrasphaera sp. F2B08]KAB7745672.1 formamidopyrimidine-DNA glycosylase [Tetrasphaera sp. F2B08]
MAEGHAIHGLARRFDAAFAGKVVQVTSPRGREDISEPLDGRRVRTAEAWGKHLLVHVDDAPTLHCHLGMNGRFSVRLHRRAVRNGWLRTPPPSTGAEHLRFLTVTHLGDLTRPTVCELLDDEGVERLLDRLGPDPLRPDHDAEAAIRALSRSRRAIGALLLDQSVVAGVGNVYRAELLHRARISPWTQGSALDRDRLESLWRDTIRLMEIGAAAGWIISDERQIADAVPYLETGRRVPRWAKLYAVYQRAGRPCGRCGSPIESAMQGRQRVFWCPGCQPDLG